jgi:transposase
VGVAGTVDPAASAGQERACRQASVDDRAALGGILFVTANGIAWKKLPTELGFGSGVTCWSRLQAWQGAGVWEKLHHAVLDQLGQDGQLDWSRTCLDSVSVRAKRGAS